MKEYEIHIKDEAGSRKSGTDISFCGESINMVFYFQNVEHALNTRRDNGRLLPCPDCKKIIIDILNSLNPCFNG